MCRISNFQLKTAIVLYHGGMCLNLTPPIFPPRTNKGIGGAGLHMRNCASKQFVTAPIFPILPRSHFTEVPKAIHFCLSFSVDRARMNAHRDVQHIFSQVQVWG